ncbi:MAG TPA: hypothetical protein VNO30_16080 [Kofleriaceae bacterium]|nr:hypothetical protein [Kofleriaceae bacterium]
MITTVCAWSPSARWLLQLTHLSLAGGGLTEAGAQAIERGLAGHNRADAPFLRLGS